MHETAVQESQMHNHAIKLNLSDNFKTPKALIERACYNL